MQRLYERRWNERLAALAPEDRAGWLRFLEGDAGRLLLDVEQRLLQGALERWMAEVVVELEGLIAPPPQPVEDP